MDESSHDHHLFFKRDEVKEEEKPSRGIIVLELGWGWNLDGPMMAMPPLTWMLSSDSSQQRVLPCHHPDSHSIKRCSSRWHIGKRARWQDASGIKMRLMWAPTWFSASLHAGDANAPYEHIEDQILKPRIFGLVPISVHGPKAASAVSIGVYGRTVSGVEGAGSDLSMIHTIWSIYLCEVQRENVCLS